MIQLFLGNCHSEWLASTVERTYNISSHPLRLLEIEMGDPAGIIDSKNREEICREISIAVDNFA